MKKLMIAFAAAAVAAVSQAATFNWSSDSSTGIAYALNATAVGNNGDYSAGTTKMKGHGTWSYTLQILTAGTPTVLDTATGSVSFGTKGQFNVASIELAKVGDGVNVDYLITITGSQTELTNRGKSGLYDYTAATLTTTLSGNLTTDTLGATKLVSNAPSTWAVSGITEVEPTPEPTSAMLMLLGIAGLALRRKAK